MELLIPCSFIFQLTIQFHTIPLKTILETVTENAKISTVIGSMQARSYFSSVM